MNNLSSIEIKYNTSKLEILILFYYKERYYINPYLLYRDIYVEYMNKIYLVVR